MVGRDDLCASLDPDPDPPLSVESYQVSERLQIVGVYVRMCLKNESSRLIDSYILLLPATKSSRLVSISSRSRNSAA